jgi:hypothetical protein
MYPKIGLGIHNIPPAPIVKLKIHDKNPSYKCDIKVPLPSPSSKTLYK